MSDFNVIILSFADDVYLGLCVLQSALARSDVDCRIGDVFGAMIDVGLVTKPGQKLICLKLTLPVQPAACGQGLTPAGAKSCLRLPAEAGLTIASSNDDAEPYIDTNNVTHLIRKLLSTELMVMATNIPIFTVGATPIKYYTLQEKPIEFDKYLQFFTNEVIDSLKTKIGWTISLKTIT